MKKLLLITYLVSTALSLMAQKKLNYMLGASLYLSDNPNNMSTPVSLSTFTPAPSPGYFNQTLNRDYASYRIPIQMLIGIKNKWHFGFESHFAKESYAGEMTAIYPDPVSPQYITINEDVLSSAFKFALITAYKFNLTNNEKLGLMPQIHWFAKEYDYRYLENTAYSTGSSFKTQEYKINGEGFGASLRLMLHYQFTKHLGLSLSSGDLLEVYKQEETHSNFGSQILTQKGFRANFEELPQLYLMCYF